MPKFRPAVLAAPAFFAVACGGSAPYPGSSPGRTGARGPAMAATMPIPEIDANIRFLSSDLPEGRAPATRGGAPTEHFIGAANPGTINVAWNANAEFRAIREKSLGAQ